MNTHEEQKKKVNIDVAAFFLLLEVTNVTSGG